MKLVDVECRKVIYGTRYSFFSCLSFLMHLERCDGDSDSEIFFFFHTRTHDTLDLMTF